MLLVTWEQEGVWELDVGFGNLMFPLWSALLGASFVFLDVGPSILFCSFFSPFFFFFGCYCFRYFMIGRVSSYHMDSWAFLTQTCCVWGISLKFQNLTVCSWLVLSSKSVATTSWKWCLRRRPIHIKTAQYLGPTELMGEKLLGGIHGNVHWIQMSYKSVVTTLWLSF
jgi:hypothetical protein